MGDAECVCGIGGGGKSCLGDDIDLSCANGLIMV